jgi:hypothetical protein
MWVWLLVLGALAQDAPEVAARPDPTPIDPKLYQDFSDRFVSTVVETRVDSQLLQIPTIRSCVQANLIEDADLTRGATYDAPNSPQNKRQRARDCFESQLLGKSDSEIAELADQLSLEANRLIPNKSRKAVTEYFVARIQNALYGAGAAGDDRRKRDKTLVDHSVFADLYENQLGKNLLMEVSRYCHHNIIPDGKQPKDPKDPVRVIALLKSTDCTPQLPLHLSLNCLDKKIEDTGDVVSTPQSPTAPTPTIYQEFETAFTVGGSPVSGADMQYLFTSCMKLVANFCNFRNICIANETAIVAGTTPDLKGFGDINNPGVLSNCPQGSQAMAKSELGKNSCLLQTKIRAFRTNLTALNKTKEQLADMEDRQNDSRALRGADSKMELHQNTGDSSVAAITTLTTKDAEEIGGLGNADAADLEQCSRSPEDPKCDEFYYTNAERVRFEQMGQVYDAATIAERRRIEGLSSDKDRLKTYLESKGYADLAERLEKGTATEAEIVEVAKTRFASEREAAYASMEERFLDKQRPVNNPSATPVGDELAKRFQSEQRQLSQLMLYNNIVTSYIEVSRGSERLTNAATREREVEAMRDNSGAVGNSLTFFENLNPGGQSSGSASNDSSSVTVDMTLIEGILEGEFKASDTNGNR